jgi:DNA-binding transcriptional ArsR family regulator
MIAVHSCFGYDRTMKEGPNIAAVGALLGDPGRANMLVGLMDGRALTATELAQAANITAQTASGHLARLEAGGLIRRHKQGRHNYFALASPEVAAVIEGLMGLAARAGHMRTRTGPRDGAMRKARVCYDHLAGETGVALFDSLRGRGLIALDDDEVELTEAGEDFFSGIGCEIPAPNGRRPLCRACLDWSARRYHLGGRLGAALLSHMQERGWARRETNSRVITFTPMGEREFRRLFPVQDV